MEKIFSKIDKSHLLHSISIEIPFNEDRINLTDSLLPLQVSRISFNSKKVLQPHSHRLKSIHFESIEPNECWIVMKGIIEVSLFDVDQTHLKTINLKKGSILITTGGGHSINHSSDDTEIIELKLGPYVGNDITYYKENNV